MKKILLGFIIFSLLGCGNNCGMNLQYLDAEKCELYIDYSPLLTRWVESCMIKGEQPELKYWTSQKYNHLEGINEKVFNCLKSYTNTEKTCEVYLPYTRFDKYGNEFSECRKLNSIDLVELRKYKSSSYWSEATCGIVVIMYGECFGSGFR